jgi:hypothetical protein
MSDSLLTLPEQLLFIHEQITAGKTAADSLIPAINSELSRMHEAGIVVPAFFLGDVVLRRGYYPCQGPGDSGQLVVAALQIPGGLCACYFDSEEFCRSRPTNMNLRTSPVRRRSPTPIWMLMRRHAC